MAQRHRFSRPTWTSQDKILPTKREHFRIPDEVSRILHTANSVQDVQTAFPVLCASPTAANYLDRMHLLLFIEEYYAAIQPKNLRISKAAVVQLLESFQSPSVILEITSRGIGKLDQSDWIFLLASGTSFGNSFQGYSGKITEIELGGEKTPIRLHIRLDDYVSWPPALNAMLDIYSTRFRVPFRHLHNALEDVYCQMGHHFLFPPVTQDQSSMHVNRATGNKENAAYFDKKLDEMQRNAADCVCASGQLPFAPYIVTGCAGTGKTRVILEILSQLTVRSASGRVLVCGYNDASVLRLIEAFLDSDYRKTSFETFPSYVFLAAEKGIANIPPPIRYCTYTFDSIGDSIRSRLIFSTVEAVMKIMDLYGKRFDLITHVIIDDAGMLTEPETLIPISMMGGTKSGKVVLVGDVHQMLPEVGSEVAKKVGLQNSLLYRLLHRYAETGHADKLVTTLSTNYRNVPPILFTGSEIFWEDSVQFKAEQHQRFMQLVHPICFRSVDGLQVVDSNAGSCYNSKEAEVLVEGWKNLYLEGIPADRVAIITPFVGQVRCIESMLKSKLPRFHSPKVGLPSQFINDEKDFILISCVESALRWDTRLLPGGHGFVNAPETSYTALSRAKQHIFVVGDAEFLSQTDWFWNRFVDLCKRSYFLQS